MPTSNRALELSSRFRRPSRRVVAVAAVILVVAVSLVWWLGRSDGAEAKATTVKVSSGTFQDTVTGSGTIEPASEADLSFDVSGRVTDVSVKAGDKVTKGEVLARLDTVSLDAALTSAEAQLASAETQAAADGAEASTQRASNDAAVASAKADLAQAKDDLAAATLRSTITGTVAAVDVAVGDQAGSSSGSASTGTGSAGGATGGTGSGTGTTGSAGTAATTTSTAAVTVVSPKTFVVEADVSADDVTSIKKGLQVQVTPNGATDAIFGTVKEVGLVAETSTSGTATFPVTVAVTGSQDGLYAGTTADVSIIVKQVQDVLTVPSRALTTSGGASYVQKVVGGGTRKTKVVVGETYGASTQITSGLSAGDSVQVAAVTGGAGGTGRTGGTGGGQGEFPGGGAPPGGGAGFGGGTGGAGGPQ